MQLDFQRLVPVRNFYILFLIFAALLCAVGVFAYCKSVQQTQAHLSIDPYTETPQEAAATGLCNVSVINLHGELFTYAPTHGEDSALLSPSSTPSTDPGLSTIAISSDIAQKIESLADYPFIKAVVLDVDSGGGSAVAGEEIARALSGLGIPTVALIHDMGASAAYEAAAGAERIFAHRTSLTGSIGITASYHDYSKYDQKEGLTYVPLYVGDFKELGNPYTPLTKEGRMVLMNQLQKSYEQFVAIIAEYRNLPYENVLALANGLVYDSQFALENKLIDEIGGRNEVRTYLTQKIGEPAVLCPNW